MPLPDRVKQSQVIVKAGVRLDFGSAEEVTAEGIAANVY